MNDRESWDIKAEEWHRFIGTDGDENRRVNSDPVLWRMLGDVRGLDVLDVGCGTGYLTRQLADRGARAAGIDASPEMVRVARRETGLEDLAVDDAAVMATIGDAAFDRVVSNYVLMDVEDYAGAIRNIARVLRPGGACVLIFLHPCFDVPGGPERRPDKLSPTSVRYTWTQPYVEQWKFTESWGPFGSPFQGYHRPLKDYLNAMFRAGLQLVEFDEPVPGKDAPGLPPDIITRHRWTTYSCALHLVKP